MLLTKARIREFRCIEDTDSFRVDDLTCLVGKNESGKTSILHALFKLNDGESFVDSRDYPKRKWTPGMTIPTSPPALETEWTLETSDVEEISAQHGPGAVPKNEATIRKGYGSDPGVRTFALQVDEAAIVKHLAGPLNQSKGAVQFASTATTLPQLQIELEAVAARDAAQAAVLQKLTGTYKDGALQAIVNTLDDLVPGFLYFDQYQRLPGQVSVDAFLKRKAEKKLTDDDRVFEALISLADTTPEAINSTKTFEEFNSSLRAVSNQITDKIFQYWTQNTHLDVELRLDMARPGDQQPFNSGPIFRTRIFNRRHRADTSFDERSSGFVWFFSFLVWFTELSKTAKQDLIILLDEPGLTLHARAQADLLRYIRRELEPEHQVLYTTHSPFMIDPDRVLNARTVEDVVVKDPETKNDKLLGTKVGQDVLSMDRDTVSPLQRALDYEMTQTLFVGKHTLLVEGESEFLYFKWFSQQLRAAGKKGLDYRWTISVARGIDRIPGFVSLFRGNGLHIAAVVDVQDGDKQKRARAAEALQPDHLLALDAFTKTTEADIEDMLGRELYAYLVNESYRLVGPSLVPKKKPQAAPTRVAKEVEAHFRTLPASVPEYNHFVPAEFLFNLTEDVGKLPGLSAALERFEALFTALNALLDPSG